MNIIFMGTPDFAAESLERILAGGYAVSAVVTKVDKPVGRGRVLQPSPVKRTAMEHHIPVLQPRRVREEGFAETLASYHPDLIIVVAFGQIIPKNILEMPKYGCINVHASLLPKYRGAAPVQWAVINGEEKSGVTIMQMNEGLDTGDMIAKQEYVLAPDETGGSLFDRLSKIGGELLLRTLPEIENGTIVPVKQPEESPTPYARMIEKKDGQIDWTRSAVEIERLVRGMNPWPSAFTALDGKTVKIWRADVEETESAGVPGEVIRLTKHGFSVQTGKGSLAVRELQMAGKRRMTADEFLRGHALREGDRFIQ